MHSHVGGRLELLVVPQHRKRFVPERGEGREPAEQTDEHERPRLWSKQLAGVGQSADHADQGSQREGHEGCMSLYQSTQPIAGERTEEPTGADRRCIDQSRFHRRTPGGWRGRNAWGRGTDALTTGGAGGCVVRLAHFGVQMATERSR